MIDIIYRNKKTFLALIILITAFSVVGLSKLKFGYFRAFPLPESDPAVQGNEMLGAHFGGVDPLTLIVESKNVFSKESLETIKNITEEVKELTGVNSQNSVISLTTLLEPTLEFDPVTKKENGFSVKPFFDQVPSTPEEVETLNARIKASPYAEGVLVNKERTAAIISASLGNRAYPDPSLSESDFLKTHFDEIDALIKKFTTDQIKVYATSTPLVIHYGQRETKIELFWIGLLGIVLLLSIFYTSIRSIRMVLLASIVMLLSLMWTFSVMGFMGIPLTSASIYLIVVILAVGSSYSIHVVLLISARIKSVAVKRSAVKLAVFDFGLPLLTVSLTSALSSISLLSFDVPDIRELGLFQATGITFSYMLSFFLLPTAVLFFEKKTSTQSLPSPADKRIHEKELHSPNKFNRLIQKLLNIIVFSAIRQPLLSLVLITMVVIFSVYGASKIEANWIVEKTMPRNSVPREGYEAIVRNFGIVRNIFIVAQNKDGNSFLNPGKLDTLSKIQNKISAIPEFKILSSLPSVYHSFRKVLLDKDDMPATQEEVDQPMLLLGKKRISKILSAKEDRTLFVVSMKPSVPKQTDELIQKLRNILREHKSELYAEVTGTPVVVNSMNHYMVTNKIESIITCLLMVLALCTLINSSVKIGFICVLPATVAALLTFSIMGYFGIPLDIGTSTITTIAIGVGVDFAVHFIFYFRTSFKNKLERFTRSHPNEENISSTAYKRVLFLTTQKYGKTIFYDAMTNVLGFGPLFLSKFPILKTSGLLLISNQLLVVLCTFFIIPCLVLLFKPDLPKRTEDG